MDKNNYKEASFYGSLDEVIEYLKNAVDEYIDFGSENGVIRIYSGNLDDDSVYLRIYGLTKDQKYNYDKELSSSEDKEFVVAKYKKISDIYFDKLRDGAVGVDADGKSLSQVISILNIAKRDNKNIYIDFRSTEDDVPIRFYSMDINVDDAFMRVMGLTKSQYDENKDRFKMAESDEELQMVITDLYQIMEQNKTR